MRHPASSIGERNGANYRRCGQFGEDAADLSPNRIEGYEALSGNLFGGHRLGQQAENFHFPFGQLLKEHFAIAMAGPLRSKFTEQQFANANTKNRFTAHDTGQKRIEFRERGVEITQRVSSQIDPSRRYERLVRTRDRHDRKTLHLAALYGPLNQWVLGIKRTIDEYEIRGERMFDPALICETEPERGVELRGQQLTEEPVRRQQTDTAILRTGISGVFPAIAIRRCERLVFRVTWADRRNTIRPGNVDLDAAVGTDVVHPSHRRLIVAIRVGLEWSDEKATQAQLPPAGSVFPSRKSGIWTRMQTLRRAQAPSGEKTGTSIHELDSDPTCDKSIDAPDPDPTCDKSIDAPDPDPTCDKSIHELDSDPTCDKSIDELDDVRDREELRQRYYGLLQELRVMLPGVQVMLAFLLSVPFSQRFPELDHFDRRLFGLSLVSSAASTVCLLTPTVLHRAANRTARRERLRWAIRASRVGMAFLAVALVSGLWCVCRLLYAPRTTTVVLAAVATLMTTSWIALPLLISRRQRG